MIEALRVAEEGSPKRGLVAVVLAALLLSVVATGIMWKLSLGRTELNERWLEAMRNKDYQDAIGLIPSFPDDKQDDYWMAVRDGVREHADALANSAKFEDQLAALAVYQNGAQLLAEKPELARGFLERRDAFAKELLDQGRRLFANREFVDGASHLTGLARKLNELPQQPETNLEQWCQEAFVLAASALFLADPAYVSDPTKAPWSDTIAGLLGSIPHPETMRRGEDAWTRRACLKVQQSRAELPGPSLVTDSVLSGLSDLVETNPGGELLREYGIADVITLARDQVIEADDATIERFGRQIDIIWKGLREVRGQLGRAAKPSMLGIGPLPQKRSMQQIGDGSRNTQTFPHSNCSLCCAGWIWLRSAPSPYLRRTSSRSTSRSSPAAPSARSCSRIVREFSAIWKRGSSVAHSRRT